MTSLTETAYYTRRGINVGIVAIILVFILRAAFSYLWELWLALNPPPAPPPTVAFDVLPMINFPESTSSATFRYSLETIDGKFPSFPKVYKVYFIPIGRENLQSKERAQELATKMGFDTNGSIITETTKEWIDPVNPLRKLRFNVATGNFLLKYDWANDPSLLENKELPDAEMTKTEAKNFLMNANLLPKELQNGKSLISFFSASVGSMIPAPSLSSADFVRIDYFRDNLDDVPLIGDRTDQSPFYLIFSGIKDEKRRVIQVGHTFWDIQKDNFATYPLRPVDEAWNDLISGSGYIANSGQPGTNLANIRKIYLAYYYSDNPTSFLQPLYVFEGDKGFVAAVTAIAKNWLKPSLPIAQ